MRILIVDDDFVSRKLLLKSMEQIGECDSACNGVEAWVAFQVAQNENRPYDILLLDIVMPEMDGREVLRLIREYEAKEKNTDGHTVKIAMATTLADKDSIIGSFRNQCDGYITKPYSRESLLGNLRKCGMLPAV